MKTHRESGRRNDEGLLDVFVVENDGNVAVDHSETAFVVEQRRRSTRMFLF
jgi:hypothetical protein